RNGNPSRDTEGRSERWREAWIRLAITRWVRIREPMSAPTSSTARMARAIRRRRTLPDPWEDLPLIEANAALLVRPDLVHVDVIVFRDSRIGRWVPIGPPHKRTHESPCQGIAGPGVRADSSGGMATRGRRPAPAAPFGQETLFRRIGPAVGLTLLLLLYVAPPRSSGQG